MRLRRNGYWKFNSNLLNHDPFCQEIKRTINDINMDPSFTSYRAKWEYLKYKICQISISFGKTLSRDSKQKEMHIGKEINSICNKHLINEDDKQKLTTLHSSLDRIYVNKAKGAYIRSRAKWMEEGEKSTAYFCRLEKRRQERNAVKTLIIDNQECTDLDKISRAVFHFYSNLYSSSYSQVDAEAFFNKISEQIPKIDDCFKNICDAEIKMEEVEKALNCLKLDKSPGSDGLTTFTSISGIT